MGRDESVVLMATRRGILAAAVAGLSGWLSGCGEDADAADTSGTPSDGDEAPPTDTAPATDAAAATPTYAEELSVTAADGYVAWGVGRSEAFVLEYEVTNRRAERYAVDVLLYPAATFESYRAAVTGEETGGRPAGLEGSALGVAVAARRSVSLDAGTYYLVVDNSGTGEGESAPGEARRVRLEATVRTQ